MRNHFRNTIAFLLLFFSVVTSYSQVETKEQIIFIDTSSSNRVISGLAYPDSLNSAINARSVYSGKLIYSHGTGTDTMFISISPFPSNYTKGMKFNFKASQTNNGPVKIKINSLPAVSLNKNVNQALDSGEITANKTISILFDGNSFQVLSPLNKPCPQGFVSVNENFCIEKNDTDSLSFYQAVVNCGDKNGKLCSWSDWIYACQKTSLGLNNMNDNFEWIDDTGNYTLSTINAKVAGTPTCRDSGSVGVSLTTKYKFRCCYYKK